MRHSIACGLLIVLFGLSACASALNAVTSRDGVSIQSGVRYSNGARGTYDIYLPEDAGPTTPVAVFFYGGNWETGDKDDYLFVGQSLAAAGIIAAIPDYRLHPEVRFPAFVEDGARAVAAVLQATRGGQFGIPAGHHPVFLMGHSAGAHIAALLSYDERYLQSAGGRPSEISGFIGLAGPYDFLPLTSERYRRIFPEATREASQPVNFVDASDPPALFITGADDQTVDPKNSRALAQELRRANVEAETRFLEDLGHIEAVVALATALSANSHVREAVLGFIRSRS